jgi:trehalose-6-phosphate synthase
MTESESNEHAIEVLSEAIAEIERIVDSNKCNPADWKKIQEIINSAQWELYI